MGGNEVSSGLLSLKGENSPVGELTTMCHEQVPMRVVAMAPKVIQERQPHAAESPNPNPHPGYETTTPHPS